MGVQYYFLTFINSVMFNNNFSTFKQSCSVLLIYSYSKVAMKLVIVTLCHNQLLPCHQQQKKITVSVSFSVHS